MNFQRIGKVFFQIIYILTRINWIDFLKYYNKKSSNVIMPSFIAGKFGVELFCWDMAYIHYFCSNKISFQIKSNIKQLTGCKIFWSPSKLMTKVQDGDYAAELVRFANDAESNQNQLFPSSYDVSFLENKTFMYRFFNEHNIRTPQTIILNSKEEVNNLILSFPLILKGEHSAGSDDVYKFDTKESLLQFLTESDYLKKFQHIILQQLIDIRKDIRVTLVGEEVVLFYWRINPAHEWKPTASIYGSTISFIDFPEKWRTYIIDSFKRTGLTMGAFDVCWQKDDLSTEPYFLEVSPRFSPNPPINLESTGLTYSKWKKKFFGKETYYKLQTKVIFNITTKYLNIITSK